MEPIQKTENDELQITPEDISNMKQEAEKEIQEVGDIDISNLPSIPDPEKLEQLKKMIDAMPREQVTQLLANLARRNEVASGNILNPEDKSYSTASSQEILRAKMRNKLNQKRHARLTKSAKKTEQEKYMEKFQELQKKKEKDKEKQEDTQKN